MDSGRTFSGATLVMTGDDYSIAVQQRVTDKQNKTADLIIKAVRNDAL